MLYDTHAHVNESAFDADRAAVLARIHANGVALYNEVGTDLADSARAIALAQTHDWIYAAAGIHPHEAQQAPADYLTQLQALLEQPKCIALGEIGLDYHYDFSPRDVQRRVFAEQLTLALAMDKPVIIHDREAHQDTMQAIAAHRGALRGVMHCYSGSLEDAKRYLNLGFYISFAGPLTFKNANKLREVAAYVPMDRVLCETDSPYLAPVPVRGKRNDPQHVAHVVRMLAEIKGISFEQAALVTMENGKNLFLQEV